MTAIAYRDGVLAADTMTFGGDMKRGQTRKTARCMDTGTIGAAAGLSGACALFRRWVENGTIDRWIVAGMDEALALGSPPDQFGAIVVTGGGRVVCVDWQGRGATFDAPFYADGSAEYVLIGAMAAGATAEEAVRIAIQYDRSCGGEVQTERVGVC